MTVNLHRPDAARLVYGRRGGMGAMGEMMTREEEIDQAIQHWSEYYGVEFSAEAGIALAKVILSRNEELRRRVEKMQAVVDAADKLEAITWDLVDAIPMKVANEAEKILDAYRHERDKLDAKEQDDASNDS